MRRLDIDSTPEYTARSLPSTVRMIDLLRTNIVANLLGSGWVGLLTLAVTPIQIHLLGVEAYGLIGLITLLQIVFGTLDLGLSASVTQTIASDRTADRARSASLANSVGSIYAIMAVLIAALLWLTAGWIATRWLKPHSLDRNTILISVRAIGLYVAFRWPIAFYTGVLNGIQRMDALNLLKASAATVRLVVGILLILAVPRLTFFLDWFALSALLELLAFGIVAHRLLPQLRLTGRISPRALAPVWRFSLTMAAIALLSMLITQMDRIFVSKMLSLQAFGYYSLAYTAGIGISLLQLSFNTASLPALAEASSHGRCELAFKYAKVSELTSFAVALPCALLVFFGADILRLWVGGEAAAGASLPLMLLSAGFFINAAVSTAFLAAVATRNAGIPAAVNGVAVLFYVPLLYFLTRALGTTGAASSWLALNCLYVATLVPLVHRKVLHQPLRPWFWHGLAAPIVAGLAVGLMKAVAVMSGLAAVTWAALLLAAPLYLLAAYFLVSAPLRAAIARTGAFGILAPAQGTSQP